MCRLEFAEWSIDPKWADWSWKEDIDNVNVQAFFKIRKWILSGRESFGIKHVPTKLTNEMKHKCFSANLIIAEF